MTIFHELQNLEFGPLLLLAVFSVAVGQGVAATQPWVLQAGKRVFVAGFLCYVAVGATELPFASDDLLTLFVRGLLISGTCYGAALLVIPFISALYGFVIVKPLGAIKGAWHRYQFDVSDRMRRRELERLRLESQRDWHLSQPQRDRLALDAERKRQQDTSDQVRRENARAECELLFSLHAPDIHNRFGRPDLEHFMQTYMGNGMAADEVERRGKELQKIIDQHRQHAKPDRKPRTIQDLADWFVQEKVRIEGLPLEPDIKDEHLIQLNIRYAELTQDLLQKMEP